ncbi:MAG TPA: signal peptidase I [Actinomycetales bacterium]|nr:signal peptidase I [Actinomycetales bacterium]
MNVARSTARWITRLVLVSVIVLTSAAVAVLVVIPRATHGVALTVLTGSMTPEIPVGSVVIDRPVDPGTLKVGDIATYQKAPGVDEYITHRITAIHTDTEPVTFTFKGDANRGADMTPIPATAIRGQVWFHVPYLGSIRDALQSHGTRGLVLAGVLVFLGGYSVVQIATGLREGRRKKKARAVEPATDEPLHDELFSTDELRCVAVEVSVHAFDGVDPAFVADLLQVRCLPGGPGRVRFMLEGSAQRVSVVRELLAPYGTTRLVDQAPTVPAKLTVVRENVS